MLQCMAKDVEKSESSVAQVIDCVWQVRLRIAYLVLDDTTRLSIVIVVVATNIKTRKSRLGTGINLRIIY